MHVRSTFRSHFPINCQQKKKSSCTMWFFLEIKSNVKYSNILFLIYVRNSNSWIESLLKYVSLWKDKQKFTIIKNVVKCLINYVYEIIVSYKNIMYEFDKFYYSTYTQRLKIKITISLSFLHKGPGGGGGRDPLIKKLQFIFVSTS